MSAKNERYIATPDQVATEHCVRHAACRRDKSTSDCLTKHANTRRCLSLTSMPAPMAVTDTLPPKAITAHILPLRTAANLFTAYDAAKDGIIDMLCHHTTVISCERTKWCPVSADIQLPVVIHTSLPRHTSHCRAHSTSFTVPAPMRVIAYTCSTTICAVMMSSHIRNAR